MQRFKRAVFGYFITGFDRGFVLWILLITDSLRRDGLMSVDSGARNMTAKWADDIFEKKLTMREIINILAGDAFFEKNIIDAAKIKRETGKNVIELWDTDPIFAKYPLLRGLARNKYFEEVVLPAQKAKEKQK